MPLIDLCLQYGIACMQNSTCQTWMCMAFILVKKEQLSLAGVAGFNMFITQLYASPNIPFDDEHDVEI